MELPHLRRLFLRVLAGAGVPVKGTSAVPVLAPAEP